MSIETTRERRLAQNEAAFREVNERVAEGRRPGERFFFICECSRRECMEGIVLNVQDYSHVRSAPDRFVLAPGHDRPEIERVVEELDYYVIVEKLGDAGAEAERLDLRDGRDERRGGSH